MENKTPETFNHRGRRKGCIELNQMVQSLVEIEMIASGGDEAPPMNFSFS